jgi:hypothetical protein
MAYSKFTVAGLEERFGMEIRVVEDLVGGYPAVAPSELLRSILHRNLPLALPSGSEKARSEWIVAPILAEVRELLGERISIHSGVEFVVDRKRGLDGFCDFLIADSPQQLVVEAPVLCAVEAKEHNLRLGIAQCIATMIAARLFNEREGKPERVIYGCVTTGSAWLFLKLADEKMVLVDQLEYPIRELDRLVGILVGMLSEAHDGL